MSPAVVTTTTTAATTVESTPTRGSRSSTRLRRVTLEHEIDNNHKMTNHTENDKDVVVDGGRDDLTQEDEEEQKEVYPFNGVNYTSYQDMVNAKRQRNQEVLIQSGLLETSSSFLRQRQGRSTNSTKNLSQQLGIKSKTSSKRSTKNDDNDDTMNSSSKRRKSSRLQGIESDGLYIDDERAGQFTVASTTNSKTNISSITSSTSLSNNNKTKNDTDTSLYYRNRINDGTPITIEQAITLAGTKWMSDTSIIDAQSFVRNVLKTTATTTGCEETTIDPSSTNTAGSGTTMTIKKNKVKTTILHENKNDTNDKYQFYPEMIHQLDSNCNIDRNVAKLCPDRIYSMCVHPSQQHLIVCAGDKSGHLSLWNVETSTTSSTTSSASTSSTTDDDVPNHVTSSTTLTKDTSTDHNADLTADTSKFTNIETKNEATTSSNGIHLLKPHSAPICCLQWIGSSSSTSSSSSTNHLLSSSYDGTIRLFDINQEQFIETFATYGMDETYKDYKGYGIEQHYSSSKFWTQYMCVDHRYNTSQCFFLATSIGTIMHIDLRCKDHVTFHEEISEKKINTLSLHPNGHSLISAGLDNIVSLWDIRLMKNNLFASNHSTKPIQPIAYYNCGRSINSAFFSPSGTYVVSTTMANKLDIFENFHLGIVQNENNDTKSTSRSKNDLSDNIIPPTKSIRHDNMTGRWLTTFHAIFHPQLDLFAVGSMRQPRCIEFYDPSCCRRSNNNKNDTDGLIRAVHGDAITAVSSRLAFHPRTDEIILCGGNSSGRVTIVRKQ